MEITGEELVSNAEVEILRLGIGSKIINIAYYMYNMYVCIKYV